MCGRGHNGSGQQETERGETAKGSAVPAQPWSDSVGLSGMTVDCQRSLASRRNGRAFICLLA